MNRFSQNEVCLLWYSDQLTIFFIHLSKACSVDSITLFSPAKQILISYYAVVDAHMPMSF